MTLLIRYVQLGIDFQGIVVDGGQKNWINNGGHAEGRKWPILFAGLMLDDPDMKAIGEKSGDYLLTTYPTIPEDYIHFGEDDQTFYVTQYDIDITHSSKWNPDSRDAVKLPYTDVDLGLPEWGIRHATAPWMSNRYLPTIYRAVISPTLHGFVLAARIMYAKNLWNHDALFDYTDRYMDITASGGEFSNGVRSYSKFTENMWDIYRSQFSEGQE